MNSTSPSTDSSPPLGSFNSSSSTPPQTLAPSNPASSVPPQSPPPTTPPSSPPPSPTTPLSSPPPSPPTSSPPARRKSPPPSRPASPPPDDSPPPTTSPSSSGASSPEATPAPPVMTPPASPSPPPPEKVSSPPPEKVSSPPSSSSSPPIKKPRENAPPNNRATPPPSDSPPAPPLSTSSSPTSTPSPPLSSSSSPPHISSAPPNHDNETLPTKPLPSFPNGKPAAESTTPSPNATSDAKSTGAGGIKTGGVVAIGIVVGFLAVGLVVLGVWFRRRQKKGWAGSKVGYQMPSPSSQNSALLAGNTSGRNCLHSPDGGVGNSKSWFAYEELAEATNGFSSQNLLGEGGFGCVYKGSLVDGREVAVKQLKIGGGQGEREFRAEVETISRIHHRHLVSLVGYCISNDQRLLVYDYVPNNTLYYHLHGQGRPLMDWGTRVKVAAGAARGIAYLHEDCHPRIIHRDIKSSNILIDDNFEAQVADFGLAKLALDANTHVTTRVMGTFGYMAPEYAASGKLTEKSDVFSFGVVLLELITGRKPVDASLPLGEESLVEWARPLLAQALENEEFNRFADPKLESKFVEAEMFRMMEAAAACVRHLASKRPRMSQVVRALDSINLDITNGMKPGQSEVFDSRQQSAEIRLFRRMAFGSKDWDSDVFNTQSSWE